MSVVKKERRIKKIRYKLRKNSDRLRLTVFRSNRYIYAQIIDDKEGKTLLSISSLKEKVEKGKKMDLSHNLGKLMAQKALKKNIKSIVFDRSGYRYHGLIKSFAEGLREGGLDF